MKKAIIFDLDGTLWDSSASVCESWNIVFSRYPEITRRLTPADVQGFMGKPLDQIFPIALPDTPDELHQVTLKEIHWLCDGLSLNPRGAFEEHHPKIIL